MSLARLPLIAALYAALVFAANAALATDASVLSEVKDLRDGSMRKLVVHDAPQPVADIRFETPEGAELSLAESAGKIRIVNFWATWCAPCRHEKPALDALNKDLEGPDFEVIALATGRNSIPGIKKFNDEVGVTTLATYLDNGSGAARAMGVLGLPVSVILDRDGQEVARLQGGADWDSASARAIVDALINSPPATN